MAATGAVPSTPPRATPPATPPATPAARADTRAEAREHGGGTTVGACVPRQRGPPPASMSHACPPDVATAHDPLIPLTPRVTLRYPASTCEGHHPCLPAQPPWAPLLSWGCAKCAHALGARHATLACDQLCGPSGHPGAPAPPSASRRPAAYAVPSRASARTSSCRDDTRYSL